MVTHKTRQVFYLSPEQHRQIRDLSDHSGATLSEIARRILGPALDGALSAQQSTKRES